MQGEPTETPVFFVLAMSASHEVSAAISSEAEEGWLLWKWAPVVQQHDDLASTRATVPSPTLRQLTLIGMLLYSLYPVEASLGLEKSALCNGAKSGNAHQAKILAVFLFLYAFSILAYFMSPLFVRCRCRCGLFTQAKKTQKHNTGERVRYHVPYLPTAFVRNCATKSKMRMKLWFA